MLLAGLAPSDSARRLLMPVRGFALTGLAQSPWVENHTPLEALRLAIPDEAISDAITRTHAQEQRRRRLPSELVVALVVGLGLWTRANLREVLAYLVEGLRVQEPARFAQWRLPAKSALTKARQRIGPRPLHALFQALAGPVASPATPGAFLCGLRLMAIDGTTLALPDTPTNVRIFGKPATRRGEDGPFTTTLGAFPLVRIVMLIESGTHVLCDAVVRPYFRGEAPAARQLLRSVGPAMLVLWDRGLHSYPMVRDTLARGAHFLGRVSANLVLPAEQVLADGSYLTHLYPSASDRQQHREGIVVRVIEYTIDDPSRPGHDVRYRLLTSLLDPARCSALTLAVTYHERWEVETTIDELKTHTVDRRPFPPIRSRNPREVVQEVYGVLIAHVAIRKLMAAAAATAQVDPDRLSFTGTLHVLRRAVIRLSRGSAPEQTPLCSTPS
jgi:hypothetical protein